jgi:DNA-binding LytR/AlgR family response regulator
MKIIVLDQDGLTQQMIDNLTQNSKLNDKLNNPPDDGKPEKPHDVLFLRSPGSALKRLAGRRRDGVHVLKMEEISVIGSEDGYPYAISKGIKYYLNSHLNQLESRLDARTFIRVHRSYMVNVEFIKVIERWPGGKYMVAIHDKEKIRLTTSRAGAERLRQVLDFGKKANLPGPDHESGRTTLPGSNLKLDKPNSLGRNSRF